MNAGNSGNLRIGGGAKNIVKPGQSNDWDLDKFLEFGAGNGILSHWKPLNKLEFRLKLHQPCIQNGLTNSPQF